MDIMDNIKLSPPWITFANEIKALFKDDPEVTVKYDETANKISLYVDNTDKSEALTLLLPEKKEFGNVTLTLAVVPSNKEKDKSDLFRDAFLNNPAVEDIYTFNTPFGVISYVVFKNKVIQFFNDQMDDINGNRSTLFQEIAKDVFGVADGIFLCTAAGSTDLMKPLGEWP